jgi:hypothetical protein
MFQGEGWLVFLDVHYLKERFISFLLEGFLLPKDLMLLFVFLSFRTVSADFIL